MSRPPRIIVEIALCLLSLMAANAYILIARQHAQLPGLLGAVYLCWLIYLFLTRRRFLD